MKISGSSATQASFSQVVIDLAGLFKVPTSFVFGSWMIIFASSQVIVDLALGTCPACAGRRLLYTCKDYCKKAWSRPAPLPISVPLTALEPPPCEPRNIELVDVLGIPGGSSSIDEPRPSRLFLKRHLEQVILGRAAWAARGATCAASERNG